MLGVNMETFDWVPDYGMDTTSVINVSIVSFGDGYEQRRVNGLNPIKDVWNLTFAYRDLAEVNDIKAFLHARKGVEAFDFQVPGSGLVKVRTDGESICKVTDVAYGLQTLTTTFKRVFE